MEAISIWKCIRMKMVEIINVYEYRNLKNWILNRNKMYLKNQSTFEQNLFENSNFGHHFLRWK